jgi:hypothetical protein
VDIRDFLDQIDHQTWCSRDLAGPSLYRGRFSQQHPRMGGKSRIFGGGGDQVGQNSI